MTLKPFIVMIATSLILSCNVNLYAQAVCANDMPGKEINHIEIDNNGAIYYVTSELDAKKTSISSSTFPVRHYLIKQEYETNEFQIVDDDFFYVTDIIFDKNNNLWARDYRTIYLMDEDQYKKVVELPERDGRFKFLAVDDDNNIWVGGSQTGLYKIDENLNVELFTKEDYPKENTMSNIHIDNENNIWIALGKKKGILKIENDKWINYSPESTKINGSIWCLVTDKNNDLWIGTGCHDTLGSLIRFDGKKWETVPPRNNKNELVKGLVRHLYADENKIYVVIEEIANKKLSRSTLLTYDGKNWNTIDEVSGDNGITDLQIDNTRQSFWVSVQNKGVYEFTK